LLAEALEGSDLVRWGVGWVRGRRFLGSGCR